MNNKFILKTEQFNIAKIDSGTTYTYVPSKLFRLLMKEFDSYCFEDPINNCKGKRITNSSRSICFEYQENEFKECPLNYFMSYPVLNFHAESVNNTKVSLKWYPSEYLVKYRVD
jgi:hypothetical protein